MLYHLTSFTLLSDTWDFLSYTTNRKVCLIDVLVANGCAIFVFAGATELIDKYACSMFESLPPLSQMMHYCELLFFFTDIKLIRVLHERGVILCVRYLLADHIIQRQFTLSFNNHTQVWYCSLSIFESYQNEKKHNCRSLGCFFCQLSDAICEGDDNCILCC